MTSGYNPDSWKILSLKNKESGEVHYRILCSWAGSYMHGSSWKLSSGIASVEKQDGHYIMPQHSGSVYLLHEGYERLSGITAGVLNTLQTENDLVEVEVLELEDFLAVWVNP